MLAPVRTARCGTPDIGIRCSHAVRVLIRESGVPSWIGRGGSCRKRCRRIRRGQAKERLHQLAGVDRLGKVNLKTCHQRAHPIIGAPGPVSAMAGTRASSRHATLDLDLPHRAENRVTVLAVDHDVTDDRVRPEIVSMVAQPGERVSAPREKKARLPRLPQVTASAIPAHRRRRR